MWNNVQRSPVAVGSTPVAAADLETRLVRSMGHLGFCDDTFVSPCSLAAARELLRGLAISDVYDHLAPEGVERPAGAPRRHLASRSLASLAARGSGQSFAQRRAARRLEAKVRFEDIDAATMRRSLGRLTVEPRQPQQPLCVGWDRLEAIKDTLRAHRELGVVARMEDPMPGLREHAYDRRQIRADRALGLAHERLGAVARVLTGRSPAEPGAPPYLAALKAAMAPSLRDEDGVAAWWEWHGCEVTIFEQLSWPLSEAGYGHACAPVYMDTLLPPVTEVEDVEDVEDDGGFEPQTPTKQF